MAILVRGGDVVTMNRDLTVAVTAERYGLVWVCPSGDPAGEIPLVEAEDDSAYRRINSGIETWAVSARSTTRRATSPSWCGGTMTSRCRQRR